MAETDTLVDVSQYLTSGCDSYSLAQALSLNEYVAAMNVVNRGGVVQTRPGSLSRLMVGGKNFQGLVGFTPSSGVAHLVYAIDGYVYVSQAPFTNWRKLPNLTFNPSSKFVCFEECLKSTDYDDSGLLFALQRPYKVLMIQDGTTRAGYWDGGTSGHLNPEPSNSTTTRKGFDETFIGLWMLWSGNRLWVARGPLVFVSDAGNPMKFTEAQYLNEGRAFYLPGDCTGMVETPDRKGAIVFTEEVGILFQTNIQDRTKWLATPDFQSTCFENVGCVAPLSIVTQYGLIWWYSSVGLINSDQAIQLNRSSRIDIQDMEMSGSKMNMGPNLTGICAVAHENYLLVSVPSGGKRNRHTWCLDQAVFENSANAWNSFWTGWNPVQWTTLKVDGEQRVFFGSADLDGCNRIWEAFRPDRQDNGTPITCWVQLRDHDFTVAGASARAMKKFRYARIFAQEILGEVAFMAAVAGTRGGWRVICKKDMVATRGGIISSDLYDKDTCMMGFRPQSREISTQEDVPVDTCNQGGVESDLPNDIDRAFSLYLAWSGRMGFVGVELNATLQDERPSGKCEPHETGEVRAVNELGCANTSLYGFGCPFEKFTATKSATYACHKNSLSYSSSATAVSYLSQEDADRRAAGAAYVLAKGKCDCASPAPAPTPDDPGTNVAPVMTAPDDFSVAMVNSNVTANLVGTGTDDGVTPIFVHEWLMVDGPAPVAFANAAALSTTVTFFATGTYVLRLAGFDGQYYASDDVTVEVTP